MSQADKLKLMVVDDEPDNLDLLYRTFRRDFRVFKADGAMSALRILDEEGEMAIIISDQRMPLMNGTEFLSKTVDRFPETIRILLTGYTDVEDLVEAINSGKVFKYITKPWNPENLKLVVQQAAETYRVLKTRTNELRRALRREELFNAVTTAIRESLDYSSMLQTVVKTIGQTFDATHCILRPVDGYQFMSEFFSYQAEGESEILPLPTTESLVQNVFKNYKTQLFEDTSADNNDNKTVHLGVPLIYQQELLGVLSLHQQESTQSCWTPEDIQLIEAVAEQAALAISQAKLYQRTQLQAQQMRDELEVARQIQNNLLRQSWPNVESVGIQTHCYPAREVGGDFFEVYIHPQGDVWLAVGDVSGKGVPAALFMASAISILRRELAQETSPEPEVVMSNLNSSMSDDLVSTNCFITMVLARYTPGSGRLVYANAGHIYPMVWSHYQVVQQHESPEQSVTIEPNYLEVRGVPLGILPIWKAKAGMLTLNSGEILLLISDGITEATLKEAMSDQEIQDNCLNTLKQSGLWQLLLQEPAPFDLNHLLVRIRERTNNVQEDDQTILSLEVL
ncbi:MULTISPECIES: SpoIIE family protein phosphatase [unclassified Coleofasciculus]|uniref:SpoIIE family protein phosphatase n=1 Tax=unclassified Coleofasciculus TaxID=2692782 RepID=UPI00188027D5|nr:MULTISPECIES: SpoIIE family protein phosphatase [unclassified Coleofasciculus]MBE9129531.1 SpoIIE family protein phosphatase [Coleofasciculus sp. LEGE 07081]MBE9152110.1 SpoIIE family protein phosphatase [Coleofasciculus sp. LEGE 07092]